MNAHTETERSQTARARLAALARATAIGAILVACGETTGPRNLGDTADAPSNEPELVAGLPAYIGTWIGEAEAPLAPAEDGTPGTYMFPSGSTQIRLEYRLRRTAQLTFGEGPAPAVTDFDVGYPPGLDYLSPTLWGSPVNPPIEGAGYDLFSRVGSRFAAAQDLRVIEGDVMRFLFQPNQGYAEWCSGQQPFAHGTYYDCMEARGYGITLRESGYECAIVPTSNPTVVEDDEGIGLVADVPVDCGKYYLCAGTAAPTCTCDEFSCFFNSELESSLFLRRVGDELIGSFSGMVFFDDEGSLTTLGSVRFRRVED